MPKTKQTAFYQHITPTPLGDMRLACTTNELIGAWFVHEQRHAPHCDTWATQDQHPILQATAKQLNEYFAHQRTAFDLPISFAWGTEFQNAVWQALRSIPHGQTRTYGAMAQHIGKPQAVRAVGAAIGKNPLSIIVPCHRVVGALGQLTGYAGGIERKAALLTMETAFMS